MKNTKLIGIAILIGLIGVFYFSVFIGFAPFNPLDATNPPTQGTPILNSTGYNWTIDNLTVYNQSTADLDGDAIKNINNWVIGDKSTILLNLPFEGGSLNGSAVGINNGTRDYSRFNHSVAVINLSWFRNGGYDRFGAYEFNGTGFLNISDSDNLSFVAGLEDKPFTISAWVNAKNFSQFYIACKGDSIEGDEYIFGAGINKKLIFTVYDEDTNSISTQSNSNLSDYENQWIHIAAVYGGIKDGLITLYLNGESLTGITTRNAMYKHMINTNTSLRIGFASNLYANGTIDDFEIWNRKLSAEQVMALYQNETNKIVSQETRGNENWYANITPNDGYVNGITSQSNTISIYSIGVNNPILNSTGLLNQTTSNLTFYYNLVNGSDRAIINWYKNNASISVLNMFFEGGSLNGNLYGVNNGAKDYSGYGNNGTVYNATWFSSYGYGSSGGYRLGGYDDEIRILDNDSLSFTNSSYDEPFSITLRIKPNNITSMKILSKGNLTDYEYMIGTTMTDQFFVEVRSNATSANTQTTSSVYTNLEGEWVHLAFVYNGGSAPSSFKIYLNGSSVLGTHTIEQSYSSMANTINNLSIGLDSDFYIDDLIIWDTNLSAEQVMALYQNETNKIVSQETELSENWTAFVCPNDGYEDGECKNATITIIPATETPVNPDGGGSSGSSGGSRKYDEEETEETEEETEEFDETKFIDELWSYNWYGMYSDNFNCGAHKLETFDWIYKEMLQNIPVYDPCIGIVYVEFTPNKNLSNTKFEFFRNKVNDSNQYLGFDLATKNITKKDILKMDIIFSVEKEWINEEFDNCNLENIGLENIDSKKKYYGKYLMEDDYFYYFTGKNIKEFGNMTISAFDCEFNIAVAEGQSRVAEERSLRDKIKDILKTKIYWYLFIIAVLITATTWLKKRHFKKIISKKDELASLKYYIIFYLAQNKSISSLVNELALNGWNPQILVKKINHLKRLNKNQFELSVYSKIAANMELKNIIEYFTKKGYEKRRVLKTIYKFKRI